MTTRVCVSERLHACHSSGAKEIKVAMHSLAGHACGPLSLSFCISVHSDNENCANEKQFCCELGSSVCVSTAVLSKHLEMFHVLSGRC